MKEIKVFASVHPKQGPFIAKGDYDFIKTEDAMPAMQAVWGIPKLMGAYNAEEKRLFVFGKDAIKIAPTEDKMTQGAAKHANTVPFVMPGIVGLAARLGAEAIRVGMIDNSGTKGFIFHYANDNGYLGICWAIAPAVSVEAILASVPADRVDLSIAPK